MVRKVKLLVCMKQVPDTQKVRIDPEKGTLIRKGVPSITNPFDESALELALEIREKVGGTITVLTMGIPESECILRDALTLGADCCYLLTHRYFAGSDTLATSYILSRAIKKIGSFDLILFGKQAIDGDTAQVGPEVSGYLGLPVVTFVDDVRSLDDSKVVVERTTDYGREIVEVSLPTALTVVKAEKRLRVPTLSGVMRSFDLPLVRLGFEEIDAERNSCGLDGSPTRVKRVFSPKKHSRVRILEGGVEEIAKKFLEILDHKGLLKMAKSDVHAQEKS